MAGEEDTLQPICSMTFSMVSGLQSVVVNFFPCQSGSGTAMTEIGIIRNSATLCQIVSLGVL